MTVSLAFLQNNMEVNARLGVLKITTPVGGVLKITTPVGGVLKITSPVGENLRIGFIKV